MIIESIIVEQSLHLHGKVSLNGAKNAALVIMASLILTCGKSRLKRVPGSSDVLNMITLLKDLGADICFDHITNTLDVDTSNLYKVKVNDYIMQKMRASVLVMGPLLARFKKAEIALPGGCSIGSRPIDLHLKAFQKLGVRIENNQAGYIVAVADKLKSTRIVLDYPSVGATENIVMASVLTIGITHIINASLEPEVLDLISVLQKMGACISIISPNIIAIEGVEKLYPVNHNILYDRLEAGTLLLAAAITGGSIELPEAPAYALDVFLEKLSEIGHSITRGTDGTGIILKATSNPKAVSFKTMPYPGFPTDLQAPIMAALALAHGSSEVHETVFENRLLHVKELKKMGATITTDGNHYAVIKGVNSLYGTRVVATDIRASCALVLAGLAAQGTTTITEVHHLYRGYQGFIEKLIELGARIKVVKQRREYLEQSTL